MKVLLFFGRRLTNITDFIAKFDLRTSPRLTVAEQVAVKKARGEDFKIQAKIKANQPKIKSFEKRVSGFNSQINKLQAKKNRTLFDEVKLFKLRNKRNNAQREISILRFESPRRIKAGTLPIIPATSIPSGVTQIQFLGETFPLCIY